MITRRRLLAVGATGTGLAALAACGEGSPPAGPSTGPTPAPDTHARLATTTLDSTLVRGPAGPGGYRPVVVGPAEPHLMRTDLGAGPSPGRATRRRALIAFAQLSDVHVLDAQSPLRVEWTDRYADPPADPPADQGTGDSVQMSGFAAAYRPHEMLTGQVADAMAAQVRAVARGPMTGRPLALAFQTGDSSDNSQANEVRWNIDLLDGAAVRVDSGDPTRWEGVADDDVASYDPHYWHPDGTPPGSPAGDDQARATYGFPLVPGLLDAARAPFSAAGLGIPWFTAFGNHDGLVQGNFPASPLLAALATGSEKLISPPVGLSEAAVVAALGAGDPGALLAQVTPGDGLRSVTADPGRRLLTRSEVVDAHFTTTGSPVGHGFTAANRRDGTAYYTVDRGRLRFIVLDSVNANGDESGSLDRVQAGWLADRLAESADRLVLVLSHHTSDTMDNDRMASGEAPRALGPEVLALLLAHAQVIAWVNGHTHRNAVTPRLRAGSVGGGLWEITTASHIDWPQQARLIELADNRDGTLSLFSTILDHAGPAAWAGRTDDTLHLAALARELAANDWQKVDSDLEGDRSARNVELVVADPGQP